MHGIDFIQDLAIILLVAGVVGWICHRLQLSVVVGFLAAGIVVGPYAPFSFVEDVGRIQTLADIGLVFLMFSIGLHLSLRKMRRLGFSLLAAVFCGAAIVYYLTRMLGAALGLSDIESLFLSAMLMVSSSAIISKVVQETGTSHERAGQLATGVAVLEDIVAIVMLTVLNSVMQMGGHNSKPVAVTLGSFVVFVVVAGVVSLLVVPWLLRKLSISAEDELQTLAVAAILFGLAFVAEKSGYSLALGAFLLGTIVAETPHRTQVERTFEGMRDVFTAVFFVAIGMQIDVRVMGDSIGLIVGLTAFAILARSFAATVGLSLIGTSVKDAMRVGLSVTTIGEFSFIIAQIGIAESVLPKKYYAVIVGVSLLTTLVAPLLIRNSDRIATAALAQRPGWLRTWHSYYYGWLEGLKARQKRNLLWQLSRKRLIQIGVEMLLVTGLLIFSEYLRGLVERALGPDWLFRNGPNYLFWGVLTLVILGPLVAIWRNISALCLLYAQVTTTGHKRAAAMRPIVEGVFKVAGATALYIWLLPLLPIGGNARWILLSSLAVAALGLVFLQRKLVYWHSELEVGLHGVFQGSTALADTHAPWLRPHGDWNMSVVDCVLPDLADCQGKRIVDLELRARFGCTVVGISRQGYMISLPAPDTVLYPRDKVLLIGTAEQVAAGKKFLLGVSGALTISEFEDIRMEAVAVPEGSRAAGRDLKTLSPAQTHQVQIAGVKRGSVRTLNPAGDEVIQQGDELLVLGTPEKIRSFRDWLTEDTPPADIVI